ncbi:GNAT family N-acetyltransferase [Cetobacterium sp.]|uniref:GNAT family N-acetyltransferase n=1 Tax=Cetobacterium sp. TaxID=2071632 RepID=UPI0025CC336C|nr:GNAT family N-acetyltransferase [uncultured Cetobacterium sp.]
MKIFHDENKELFYIKDEDNANKTIGRMSYRKKDDHTIIIEHTLVDESYKGKGIGNLLMDEAVVFVRKNSFKIIPECSFVKFLFNKYPEKYKDVI